MTTDNQITMLPTESISQSQFNPRRIYDPQRLDELADSFRSHGFDPGISHLLVRPAGAAGKYELVCGHRRLGVAGYLGLDQVPAIVRPMTDVEVMETQLVENLQRADLSPMEEAAGVCRLLEMRDAKGKPMHTAASVARQIGKTSKHVTNCRLLSRLRGSRAATEVEAGTLSVRHGTAIARVPSALLREEVTVAALEGRMGMPMPAEDLEKLIREEYSAEIRGAEFDPEDSRLVAVMKDEDGERIGGGACEDCPMNSKNTNESGKFAMCLNVECHREKTARADEAWAASVAGEGITVLGRKEGARILDYTGKRVAPHGGWVDLAEQPHSWMLEDDQSKPGKWKQLLRGRGVPVTMFKGPDGTVFEVVDKELAVVAAVENGHDIFEKRLAERARTEADEQAAEEGDVEAKARREEARKAHEENELEAQREREIEARVTRVSCAALYERVRKRKGGELEEDFWQLILGPILDGIAEFESVHPLAVLLGCEIGDGSDHKGEKAAIEGRAAELPCDDLTALVLLAARELAPVQLRPHWDKKAHRAFGVDVKAIRKTVEAEMKAEVKALKAAKGGAK